jgi:hypothetical protein
MINVFLSENWQDFTVQLEAALRQPNDVTKHNILLGEPSDPNQQIQTLLKLITDYRDYIEYVRLIGDQWYSIDQKNAPAVDVDWGLVVVDGFGIKIFNEVEQALAVESRPQAVWWVWNIGLDQTDLQSYLNKK